MESEDQGGVARVNSWAPRSIEPPAHFLYRFGTQQFVSLSLLHAVCIKAQDNECVILPSRRRARFTHATRVRVESFQAILLAVGCRVMTSSLHAAVQVQNELPAVDLDPPAPISMRGGP